MKLYLIYFRINEMALRASHDVTKIQTQKISILLSFHFHEVLKNPNTFIYTNFRCERVIRYAIDDA